MSLHPSVAGDIEVLLSDGTTWQTLALAEAFDNQGGAEHKTLDQQLSALIEGLPLGQQMHPLLWVNRGRGIGYDYGAAYGLYTRTPGIVTPAGAATSVQVTLSAGSASPIVAIEEYGADLFVAQRGTGVVNTGRIMRSPGGTGTGGGALVNSLTTAVNRYVRDLCLFGKGTTGAGARYLYASSTDVNGLNGQLHRWDGATWVDSGLIYGTMGFNRMARVFWTDRSGLSWARLVAISRPNMIAYTDVGADPFVAASWIEVEIDTAKTLLDLGGARRHVWMRAQDNVFDLNEKGESPALQAFDSEVSSDGCIQYLNGYLYVASGRTLNRIYVGDPTVTVQEAASQCFPGFGTPAENDIRGYITAMCVDQGYLVAAVYNPSVNKTFICWGTDQGVPQGSPNPLNWYGPEVFFDNDYKVTRMRTSGLAGDLRLWVAAQSVAGGTAVLNWASLPIAGAPLQDMISGGGMRFANGSTGSIFMNTYCRLELLPTDWNGATSIADQHVFVTRGLSKVRAADGTVTDDGIGTRLTLEVTSDPAPGAVTWPTGDDVTTTPSQIITPATATKGERIWRRIKFFSPNGASSPPKIGVLDACRVDSWVVAPTMVSLPLTVMYGAGISNLSNQGSDRDPEWITDQLTLLTTGSRTTLKTRDGRRYTVKLVQVLDRHTEYTNTGTYGGKVVTAKLLVQVLGLAA